MEGRRRKGERDESFLLTSFYHSFPSLLLHYPIPLPLFLRDCVRREEDSTLFNPACTQPAVEASDQISPRNSANLEP